MIDVISAFSRISDKWDQKGTVQGLISTLPSRGRLLPKHPGPKAAHERVQHGLAKGESIRTMWLRDAYLLRNKFAHGRVDQSPYRSTWTEREHLLLAAVVFPLYVKAVLEQEGFYTIAEDDAALNLAFDTLATLEPFSEQDDEDSYPWNKTIAWAEIERLGERIERELGALEPDGGAEAPGVK